MTLRLGTLKALKVLKSDTIVIYFLNFPHAIYISVKR